MGVGPHRPLPRLPAPAPSHAEIQAALAALVYGAPGGGAAAYPSVVRAGFDLCAATAMIAEPVLPTGCSPPSGIEMHMLYCTY